MKINKILYPATFGLVGLLAACTPNEDESNGLTNSQPLDATFTVTPVDGSTNRLRLNGTTDGVKHRWDNVEGSDAKVVFYPLAGQYEVSHTVCGKGGVDCVTATQTIDVPSDDPIAFNRIEGGSFDTPADIAKWTILPMSSDAHWTFADGKATLTSGPTGWAQEGLYQAIQVEAGHTYRFDMTVSGPGWTDSVFELYADFQQPVPNSGDYNAGGKILALNTWAGCGNAAFSGQFFTLSCDATPTLRGYKKFNQTGTVYVLVRGGGANGNFNITIDNFEVRAID